MAAPRPSVVLVVEDQPELRGFISRVLSRDGLTTLEAGDAREGFGIIERANGSIDLVITDMVMPGMSGLDLGADVAREYPALRVLYVSGYVDSLAMQVIAEHSPEAVLLKPFTPEALLERVRRLLAKASIAPSPPL